MWILEKMMLRTYPDCFVLLRLVAKTHRSLELVVTMRLARRLRDLFSRLVVITLFKFLDPLYRAQAVVSTGNLL